MVAVLTFKMSELRLKNRPLTKKDQERLFGRKFEELLQIRRIQVLKALGFIDILESKFREVNIIRNNYLHLWEKSFDDIEKCTLG